MTKSLPTVTIGIPAYNEIANLRHLIPEIMAQSKKYYLLKKILIISDGSTDGTESLAKEFLGLPVELILGTKRLGKPARLNQIFARSTTDGVVILDADTILSQPHTLDILVKDLLVSGAVMISGHVEPLDPDNMVAKIAWAGVGIWTQARSQVPQNSLYNCDGMIRAFSQEVYQHLTFKSNSAEDSYSYLYVISHGYNFIARKAAVVYYRLPTTFSDYLSQQRRYLTSVDIMSLDFDSQLLQKELSITPWIKLRALISYFASDPLYTFLYLIFAVFVRATLFIAPQSHSSKWKILSTTKRIRT